MRGQSASRRSSGWWRSGGYVTEVGRRRDVHAEDPGELSFAIFHGYGRNTLLEAYQGVDVVAVGVDELNEGKQGKGKVRVRSE